MFLIIFWKYSEGEKYVFEISERKNDLEKIRLFMRQSNLFLVGFNIVHFDNLLLNKLVKFKYNNDWREIVTDLKELADLIISDKDRNNYDLYKEWKWKQSWSSIDLFLYWAQLTRRSKKLSLKSLAVNLRHDWIQELPIHHNALVEDYDEVIKYCHNDCAITKELCDRLKEDIIFRFEIQKDYGINCLSMDGASLGAEYLALELSKITGLSVKEIKAHKTHRTIIKPKEFLPKLEFNNGENESYYNFLLGYEGKV